MFLIKNNANLKLLSQGKNVKMECNVIRPIIIAESGDGAMGALIKKQ